ncbi:zf-TFIIB domain-containing protein [Knoellia sp. 3-2P3]|uniref:TFIIB-type zinc ribbon-containing protein n=1 Tax=unclassified Knoellia TaxID=2618719 RepID=UPI0023DA1977|nr:zf-TFIIB domain-containing protein [Knoellia sp. 3-2P3]MDF2091622.1 zf-TFIIB domain-containing protein [Knoellia sp. 3-2P3]
MTTTLTCPKCGSDMRQYERNRVLVDQCTGCGGLFLDRGELERLVAAENEWHQPPVQRAQQAPRQQYSPYPQQHGQPYGHGYGKPHKKRRSFLSDLFDD